MASAPAEAAFPGMNGRIAFSTIGPGNRWTLYTIRSDGSNLQQLLPSSNVNDFDPVWSPDGMRVAFRRQVAPSVFRLYVANADGSGARQVTTQRIVLAPSWSPDGQRLAFGGDVSGPSVQVFTVDADGTDLRQITHRTAPAGTPQWSPAGDRIAFVSSEAPLGPNHLYTMRTDGSDQVQLTPDPISGYAWSPDADTIAVGLQVGANFQVHLMPSAGGTATPITDHASNNYPRAFAPDGQRILFFSDRDTDDGALLSVRLDGSDVRPIYSGSPIGGGDWEPRNFTDVAASIFRDDIAWAFANGITDGCAPQRFCPEASVTRGQMASFLARALEMPPATTDFFGDDAESIHHGDINRVAAAGITAGCGPNRFCPDAVVNREQMASFLARAFDLPATTSDAFTDDETSIHEADINRVAAAGITMGCAPDRFCPRDAVTRGQMAAFLHRSMT